MPNVSSYNNKCHVDMKIDVEEFLNECSGREIREVIDYLKKEGHINYYANKIDICSDESIYEDMINKLHGKWNRLGSEQERMIAEITNRF